MAEGAFVHIAIGMLETGVIGTGFDASPAPDTFIRGYQDNPSFYGMARSCGTASHTRCVVAVIAAF
jgi:hypothetical protein